jgi:catechol 2,3-dioxygenase-like lactoylglutathione lyase family enzyme
MAEFPPPPEGIALTRFIVSDDVERSKRFYTEVLGGRLAFSGPGGLTYVALANTWIIINVGGGPTDDKPTVTLETPRDLDRVSSFLNIRVKDIHGVYADWNGRGADFLTPPKQHQYEIRCYIRDPDGHLIEVGQTTDPEGDWSPPTEMVLTHFIVSDDVERSKRFYTEVLGGRLAAARPTTNRRSPWRRRVTSTGSAASSTSGSKTSTPCTPTGTPAGRNS